MQNELYTYIHYLKKYETVPSQYLSQRFEAKGKKKLFHDLKKQQKQ